MVQWYKESAGLRRRPKRHGFNPWVGKIPWGRKWQPTPVFLPGKSHGQRSLAGSSPRGHRESDTTAAQTTTVCVMVCASARAYTLFIHFHFHLIF